MVSFVHCQKEVEANAANKRDLCELMKGSGMYRNLKTALERKNVEENVFTTIGCLGINL